MKYCEHCGAKMEDNDQYCSHCGKTTRGKANVEGINGMIIAIKVFLLLSCIVTPFSSLVDQIGTEHFVLKVIGAFLPLAWCIPLTVISFRKLKDGEAFSTALKVCILLFVNLIAGILLFVLADRHVPAPAQSAPYEATTATAETPFAELNAAPQDSENTDDLKF